MYEATVTGYTPLSLGGYDLIEFIVRNTYLLYVYHVMYNFGQKPQVKKITRDI